MSSDGTRKQTRGWDISPMGQMINIVDSDDVAVEEPPSGPVAAAAAAPTSAAMDQRPRKNTLERFNDEMSVLERPLEGEAEYFDEAPPPSRWKRAGVFVGIVAIVGLGGGFAMSRRNAAVIAVAQAPATAAAVAATTAAVPPAAAKPEPTVLAAAAPAAAAEAPAAPTAAEDDATEEDSAQPAPSSHGAWDKVKSRSAHAKHSRSTSGKTAHHSASKHVAGKHASSRHH